MFEDATAALAVVADGMAGNSHDGREASRRVSRPAKFVLSSFDHHPRRPRGRRGGRASTARLDACDRSLRFQSPSAWSFAIASAGFSSSVSPRPSATPPCSMPRRRCSSASAIARSNASTRSFIALSRRTGGKGSPLAPPA